MCTCVENHHVDMFTFVDAKRIIYVQVDAGLFQNKNVQCKNLSQQQKNLHKLDDDQQFYCQTFPLLQCFDMGMCLCLFGPTTMIRLLQKSRYT